MTAPASDSDFSSTITRVAVAQICQSVGYNAAQTSALDTLADVAGRYLGAIGHAATASANTCGRTQSNVFDIINALEELGSVQGFIGAPNIPSHCLISSWILKEIMRFSYYSDEIPFAQPIPRKVWAKLESESEWRKTGSGKNLSHVPRWLPDIPVMGMGMGVERNGEWGNFGGGFGGEERNQSGVGKEGNGKGEGFELAEKRGKVRFRVGMGGGVLGGGIGNRGVVMEMRNGGFGRGGIGKRILWQSWDDGDGNEDGQTPR